MDRDTAEKRLIEVVKARRGCIEMELVCDPAMVDVIAETPDVLLVLDEMVKKGQFLVIDVILPESNRIRSYYFPGGTRVNIRNQG